MELHNSQGSLQQSGSLGMFGGSKRKKVTSSDFEKIK